MSRKTKKKIPVKKMVYSRDLTHTYHEFNRLYFDNALPNLEVFYAHLPARNPDFRYGVTAIGQKSNRPQYIAINRKLRSIGTDVSHLTLLHEMIHAKYPDDPKTHDSSAFKQEVRRLVLAGAFDGLI